MGISEAAERAGTFVSHAFAEQTVDLGEVRMNYVVQGDPQAPALLLVPGGTESWWTYEDAIGLLAERFQVFAVDPRGQGRSTWTPGRYTADAMAGDLVHFLDLVAKRPAIVAGNSVGGVLVAWLAAFAKPGQVRGVVLEDPPLFACQTTPAYGPGLRHCLGPLFQAWAKWLGDQWTVGDWDGMVRALPQEIPAPVRPPLGPEAPQNMKEMDPEMARSWASGLMFAGCDHETMLTQVKVPVLFTHHFRKTDEESGYLLGASTDLQARNACRLMREAGQDVTYTSLPDAQHVMHTSEPERYVKILGEWTDGLG